MENTTRQQAATENDEFGQEGHSAEEAPYMVHSPDPPRDGANKIQQPSTTQLFLPTLTSTDRTPAASSSIAGLPLFNPCNEYVLGLKRIENEIGKASGSNVHPLRGELCYDVIFVHSGTSDNEKVPVTVSHRIWTGKRLEDLQHVT